MTGERDDLKLRVHHIGGIGNCGPTEAFRALKDDVTWVIYDADKDAISKVTNTDDKNVLLIEKCIGRHRASSDFHVMLARSASSLRRSAPQAANYTLSGANGSAQIWGKHTSVERSVKIDTHSLDELFAAKEIPSVDFLSIDAQGAELDIINGANKLVESGTLGVVCEVEFSELYEGQAMFGDIHTALSQRGFRLCSVANSQFWNCHPYPPALMGRGFQVVGEALFLRQPDLVACDDGSLSGAALDDQIIKLSKLATIGIIFDQLDFSVSILETMRSRGMLDRLTELSTGASIKYVDLLLDLSCVSEKILRASAVPTYESSNVHDRTKGGVYEGMRGAARQRITELLKATLPPNIFKLMRSTFRSTEKDRRSIINVYKRHGIESVLSG